MRGWKRRAEAGNAAGAKTGRDTVAPKVRAGLCCEEGDAATETDPGVVTLRFYFLT